LSKEIAMKDWSNIWLAFAAYALVIAIFFALCLSTNTIQKN
jgi:hypothetical protein